MLSTFIRISSLLIILMCMVSTAKAGTALVMHSNYSDAHTNVKAQLEADGHTVTYQTSGVVPDNLISNYDIVFDLKYNNNIGSNGKARYDDFVENGGILVLVGENHVSYSNTNNTVRAFIQNKLGGTLTFQGTTGSGSCGNDCSMTQTNTSAGVSSYSNVGVYAYGAHFTGDGTWTVKSTSGKILWMKWSGSELPNGYTGEVYVTFDINQFTTTYDGADMANFIGDLYASASTPQAAITTSQQTTVNTARSKTQAGNKIYMTQSGSGIDLDIVQDGDDNLIIGTDLTNAATITGDNIELTITQKNNDNVLGIDINGNSNDVDIWQDTSQRAIVDITGASNTVDLEQLHLTGSGAHHSSINVAGNSNSIIVDQKETGDKILFLDVDSSNTVDIDQLGTGNHFLDINLTDNHTVTVTQDGTGTHNGYLNLSGNPTTVDLTQDSSNNQNYHLQQSCATTTCSVSVTQN